MPSLKGFRRSIVPPIRVPVLGSVRQSTAWPSFRPWLRSLAAVAALVFALMGVTLVGQGAYIHVKARVAQVLLHRAFAETVARGHPVKPWSWADTWPVARVEVPRLGAEAVVLAGASGQALAFGPGHVPNTAQPGAPGTTVFAAHRDTHFSFVGDLKIDDEIRVTGMDGNATSFRVTRTAVVRWDKSGIDKSASGKNLVLATCWPLAAKTRGPWRFLVYAKASF